MCLNHVANYYENKWLWRKDVYMIHLPNFFSTLLTINFAFAMRAMGISFRLGAALPIELP